MAYENQTRVIRSYQEYPGSTIWQDKEILCPECGQWTENFGDVDQQNPDGSWHMLCIPCGNAAMAETQI